MAFGSLVDCVEFFKRIRKPNTKKPPLLILPSESKSMFSTSIIPTVGRSSLTRAVCSVLDQRFDAGEFEVVVINDSGRPLPEMEWQFSEQVTIITTQCRERSVARNVGAAVARGRYLHFLDDDDLFLPGALQAFWELAKITDAIWLHGHYQAVDNQGKVLKEFDPEMEGEIFAHLIAGEGIPLQASLLDADFFFKAGAFDPTIPGVEDRDLCRRMALLGKTAGTRAAVAQIRVGEQGSTTDWSKIAERDRWGREKALLERGAYAKIRTSATHSYWRGRASRACLASMVWNLQRKNIFTAASRALASLAISYRYALSGEYWKGLRTKIK